MRELQAPAVAVTMRDKRCSMVNLHPDSARPAPEIMKATSVPMRTTQASTAQSLVRVERRPDRQSNH